MGVETARLKTTSKNFRMDLLKANLSDAFDFMNLEKITIESPSRNWVQTEQFYNEDVLWSEIQVVIQKDFLFSLWCTMIIWSFTSKFWMPMVLHLRDAVENLKLECFLKWFFLYFLLFFFASIFLICASLDVSY